MIFGVCLQILPLVFDLELEDVWEIRVQITLLLRILKLVVSTSGMATGIINTTEGIPWSEIFTLLQCGDAEIKLAVLDLLIVLVETGRLRCVTGELLRVSSLLSEELGEARKLKAIDNASSLDLRILCVRFLQECAICDTDFSLYTVEPVVSKLVHCLSEQMDNLYRSFNYRERRVVLVENIVKLLCYAHLNEPHPEMLLTSAVNHESLLSMTRIAFSEGMVYDNGFDEQTLEGARHILEMCMTMEEADALYYSMNPE
ncbi:uncharacterized protein V1510DRAFT_446784 [Dipodascopsis tothii]|uniref:uncharacterized protein n=1 Tax=Dipodascopsis tothii TaxID=44089 RepID=UPI0034D01EC2